MRVTYFAQTFNKQICNKTNADSCSLSQCQRVTLSRMTRGFPDAVLPICHHSWTCNNDDEMWRKVSDAANTKSVTAGTLAVGWVASWCDGDCLYVTAWTVRIIVAHLSLRH